MLCTVVGMLGCDRPPRATTRNQNGNLIPATRFIELADWNETNRCYLHCFEYTLEVEGEDIERYSQFYTNLATALSTNGRPVPNAELDQMDAAPPFVLIFYKADNSQRWLLYFGGLRRIELGEPGGTRQLYAYDDEVQEFLSGFVQELMAELGESKE